MPVHVLIINVKYTVKLLQKLDSIYKRRIQNCIKRSFCDVWYGIMNIIWSVNVP